jgi:hypothetical protein
MLEKNEALILSFSKFLYISLFKGLKSVLAPTIVPHFEKSSCLKKNNLILVPAKFESFEKSPGTGIFDVMLPFY